MDTTIKTAAVQNTAHQGIDKVTDAAHQTVDKIASAATPAADWVNENARKLKQVEQQLVSDASNYVRQHPLAAVGVAVVAGMIISKLMQR